MGAQAYLELKKRHVEEIGRFPIAYAFNEEQLEQALIKLNAKKEECVSLIGCGDIMKRSDVPAFKELMKRHDKELQEFLLHDEKEAEEAFLYEMDNHEYTINWSGDEDVMDCFNVDYDKLDKMGLRGAYLRARNRHMKHAEEWV